MDQGWAALIAGVIGTAAALGVGFIGGRAAVKGPQVGAQESGRENKELWLQQERTRVYGRVHDAYTDIAITAPRIEAMLRDRISPSDEDIQELERAWGVLRQACSGTRFFGPESVLNAALQLRNESTYCRQGIRAWRRAVTSNCPDDDFEELRDSNRQDRSELKARYEEFMDASQLVLTKDATRWGIEPRR